jgi:benzoyl-CoA-dihydrodiol lyase
VDEVVKPAQWNDHIRKRAQELANESDRPPHERGVELKPLKREIDERGYHYEFVDVAFDREARAATIAVRAPEAADAHTLAEIRSAGASWWPLQMARELDDAILMLRTNELELGLWIFKTSGSADAVLEIDRQLFQHRTDWFVREVIGMLRRAFARLDVSSRSMYAVIEESSCFAGTLFELALAADRSYMLNLADNPESVFVMLSEMNFDHAEAASADSFAPFASAAGTSRLALRFYGDQEQISKLRSHVGKRVSAEYAAELGLVTAAPDDLDWSDELRLAIESRVALSPDALTGLEANLRFPEQETRLTRIFGRLSAWQNWIFIRPNAVGQTGALKVYGTGNKAKFNWERV